LTPHQLFAGYLDSQGVSDDRLGRLFARLLDETASPDGTGAA
jgi:hypothetical protein